ncbi:MAG: hypothetical protein IJ725_00585, partial [Ruminococcus sp.]|nr:hypothetical protein [Ruminococcus sp.]
AFSKEKVELPDVADITEIRFDSTYSDGYTHISLRDNGDGSCGYNRECKFDVPEIFTDEKTLPTELFDKFRAIIKTNAMLIWSKFPESRYKSLEEKSLTLVFKDKTEINIPNDRLLPEQIRGAFFSIELELNS